MEEYFLYLINNFSLEIFLLSLAIFYATMLIKIPIKRTTSKLDEAKRQGINTLIMLVSLTLAFIACLVYFWLSNKPIFSLDYVSCSLSTCIMSITIYLIYARIVIIIKGIISGKTKISAIDLKDTVSDITEAIKNKQESASENLTAKEKLNEIQNKINTLVTFKQQLENDSGVQNLTAITETNNEIKLLQDEQEKLLAKNN